MSRVGEQSAKIEGNCFQIQILKCHDDQRTK